MSDQRSNLPKHCGNIRCTGCNNRRDKFGMINSNIASSQRTQRTENERRQSNIDVLEQETPRQRALEQLAKVAKEWLSEGCPDDDYGPDRRLRYAIEAIEITPFVPSPTFDLAREWIECHSEPRAIEQLAYLIEYVEVRAKEQIEQKTVDWQGKLRSAVEHVLNNLQVSGYIKDNMLGDMLQEWGRERMGWSDGLFMPRSDQVQVVDEEKET